MLSMSEFDELDEREYDDVRFTTTVNGYRMFLDLLPDHVKTDINGLFSFANGPQVYCESGNGVMFGWNDVCWKGTVPLPRTMDGVDEVMSAYRETALRHSFQYARIGVGYDDIEYEETPIWYDDLDELDLTLNFSRKIVVIG